MDKAQFTRLQDEKSKLRHMITRICMAHRKINMLDLYAKLEICKLNPKRAEIYRARAARLEEYISEMEMSRLDI